MEKRWWVLIISFKIQIVPPLDSNLNQIWSKHHLGEKINHKKYSLNLNVNFVSSMSWTPWTTCCQLQRPTSTRASMTNCGPPSTRRSACPSATFTPTTRICNRIRSARTDHFGPSTSSSSIDGSSGLFSSPVGRSARSRRTGPTPHCRNRRITTSPKRLKTKQKNQTGRKKTVQYTKTGLN